MRRRLLATAAALVLALLGTMVLVAYARGADSRAMAGMTTVSVLVVDQRVPAGTRGDQLGQLVRTMSLPAKAAAPGRVETLAQVASQVASVDLQPGEQLLTSRFVAANQLRAPGTVAVPAGLQEVSVLLEAQRAVGGRLAAGDTVGVFVSLAQQDAPSTSSVLHSVLVTQVQGAVATSAPSSEGKAAAPAAPAQSVMVTLALNAKSAEAVVFGAEHGKVWLALEPSGADTTGTKVISKQNVYTEVYR